MNTATLLSLLSLVAHVSAHNDDALPINPSLGVPGYPDCQQPVETAERSVEASAQSLVCAQRTKDFAEQKSIACVGDSITAGVHASSGATTYPSVLQTKLGDGFKVTNLGACGSTMLKAGDSPFWKRPQYAALTAAKWDVVIIMLGTNDAKDAGSGGPHNWPHDCTGGGALTCPFARDYASLIELVKTLGTTPAGPEVYVMIPPPLMQARAYGMNQTVINQVFPTLVPAIAAANHLRGAIDLFDTLGGNDQKDFPPSGCSLDTLDKAKCGYYCSATQSWKCDQCHPDDAGYAAMAEVVHQVLVGAAADAPAQAVA